jgi:glutamate-ammonia-ligase adenylyltransferase
MTPTSDMDLVFVYETPDDAPPSNGAKPLPPAQYFARLGQRYINALSVPTSEGTLYEVDMRLRPSGNSGPIACTIDAFDLYHEENAWTWERLALTRARTVTGPADLQHRVNTIIRKQLSRKSDPETLLNEVASMRVRIDSEHHTQSPWSIKHLRGGLVDVEFITQYLLLRHAHQTPDILSPNTWRAIKNLHQYGYLDKPRTRTMLRALDLWQALQSRLHLSLSTDAPPNGTRSMPIALQERLARLGGTNDIAEVEALIISTAQSVYTLFQEIIGEPKLENDSKNTS